MSSTPSTESSTPNTATVGTRIIPIRRALKDKSLITSIVELVKHVKFIQHMAFGVLNIYGMLIADQSERQAAWAEYFSKLTIRSLLEECDQRSIPTTNLTPLLHVAQHVVGEKTSSSSSLFLPNNAL